MKEVIAALRAQRKTHTAALKQIDAMLKRAGVEGKAKRRRARTTPAVKAPAATPETARAKAAPARPPVKALRAALKSKAAKSPASATPANGRASKSSDLFSDD